MQNIQGDYYKNRMRQELTSRMSRNPRYSIRALSAALKVDPGTLSRVLSGKQIPSFKLSKKILEGLGLSPVEQEKFLSSVLCKQKSRHLERIHKFPENFSEINVDDLSTDTFHFISEWYHIAILELTFVSEFRSNEKWIAKRLGITELESKMAIERLLRLGLLRIENKRLKKTNSQLSTTSKDITNSALKANQKQLLTKAIRSIDEHPIEKRSMTAMTMAIDPSKIPDAKKLISEFNRKMCRLLETGPQTNVYSLEIALFPLEETI